MIAHALGHLLAELGEGLAEVFLHLLLGAEIGDEVVDTLLHSLRHHRLLHLHGVDVGLMQEKLLDGELLGDDAIGIARDRGFLVEHLLVSLLDFALVYRLVAHHPGHLLNDVVVGSEGCKCECAPCGC